MATHSRSNKLLPFVSVVVFFVIACNNKTDEKSTATTDTTSSTASETKSPVTAGLTPGVLDTLFAVADSVRKLPEKKLVFAFIFKTNDTLTIDGWSAEKDSIFTLKPDLETKKYAPSTVNYSTGIYFGNMVLKKKEVKELQRQLTLNPTMRSVLFAPKLVDVNHIAYDIFLSTENPAVGDKIKTVTTTGLNINPSPPKTY